MHLHYLLYLFKNKVDTLDSVKKKSKSEITVVIQCHWKDFHLGVTHMNMLPEMAKETSQM